MGKLVQAATEAFNNWKATTPVTIDAYDKISDEDVISNYRTEQKYLIGIRDATEIESSFYAARTEALQALETKQLAERQALAALWQAKEDADYDVDA
jgi:hypothetical protein